MRVSAPILFIFILACASHPKPEWLGTQPQVQGYWFGIGIVQKSLYENECREEARNKALADISSQILIDVSGSFKRIVTENNLDMDEFTESVIQTRVDKNLPKVEFIDFYDSKEMCGFLARLSESIYYETIERQRRNAVQSALDLLGQAESVFNVQTFTYLSEAISEIVPYLDIPIEEEYPSGSGKTVNLYSYIKVQANISMNRLSLVPEQENLEIKLGFVRDLQLGVSVIDKKNNSPIKNIPVICYLKDKGENISALSNTDGDCIFSMPPIIDKNSIQYLNYEVNIAEILENPEIFGALSQIHAQSTIQVYPPKIFIHIIENNLGSPTDNPYVQPVISELFSRNFSASFVDNSDADLLISGTVNTRSVSDAPNDFGIFQVFGDMTISISNGETGEEILEKSFNKIQGSDFQSNREAANQALRKMSEKITKDLLPEIIDLLKGV